MKRRTKETRIDGEETTGKDNKQTSHERENEIDENNG